MKNSEKELLLVEDEALIAIQQKKSLESHGYRVHHVYNANEAVKVALDPKSGFDLILMDIDLGSGMDGTEAAQLILKHKEIPLIFVSSHTEPELVQKTSRITSYGYVIKDSGIAVLDVSIKMALNLFATKQEVIRSENRHRQLFETMSPGVVYHSSNGTIISANAAAEKILGLTIDQMNGKTSMDPRWKMIDEHGKDVPGSDHPEIISLRTGKKSGPVDRAVFIPEQNRYVWLTITATPLFNPGEERPFQVYATFDDITKRKQAELELKEKNSELDQTNEELHATLEELEATNEQLIRSQNELVAHEKLISQSDNRFKAMLKLVPDMISIQDADMNILYSNWRGIADVPENQRLTGTKCHKTYRGLDDICPDCLASSVIKTGKMIRKDTQLPNGRWFEIHAIPLLDENNKVTMFMEWVRDITENKQAQFKKSEYEWIKEKSEQHTSQKSAQPYGDITKYNTNRLILDSVGIENLEQMAKDVMSLLDTSIAVYESNGDYAYGLFESGWCRFMDSASFNLCGTNNIKEALNSGKWLCHDSCWRDTSLKALESGKPVDINCAGGINLYAVPIMTHDKVAGVVSIGYGNPPK
ncbi:MAG: PAS domain S-box protein, partial [Spirochaetes bacterium]|nr:PAS domain S-box protein [Spirochaetota bacterium]